MNEGLFSAYESRDEWKTLTARLAQAGCTSVYEIAEGERPFLAAALRRKTSRPVVLLCSTELVAQRYAQDIERLTGEKCGVLPPRDLQFSRAASSRESTWLRLRNLDELCRKKARILCLSLESLLDRCVPKDVFSQSVIALEEGRDFPPEELMRRLLASGYERVSMVEGCGQCAMRGSILDVFPPNEGNALRIEFFDTQVDSIRRFDCISQRSIERLSAARIAPATECLVTDREAAAERLRRAIETGAGERAQAEELPAQEMTLDNGETLPALDEFLSELDALELSEDLLDGKAARPGKKAKGTKESAPEKEAEPAEAFQKDVPDERRHLDEAALVEAGQTLRTAPMWMNVLCEQTVSALDYLDDPILLCDRPEQYAGRLKVLQEEFAEAYEDARLRGDAFDEQKNLRFSYDELLADWAKRPVVSLSDNVQTSLGRLVPDKLIAFGSKPPMPYQNQLGALGKDIKAWKEQNCAIILLTGGENRGRRLQKTLEEMNIPSVYCESLDGNIILREVVLLPVSYNKGFLHPDAHLCVLSDTDIFGSAYHRARKKQNAGERISSFTDLKPGDYVVHDLHGVGIYLGVTQMKGDGVTRDYLQIQYAGNDKLYVPADQFDRVQKFIGAEHSLPKLNHLGGGEWERQKSKVKAGLKKLAFDLAALYARRAKNPGYAFSHENPWQQEFEDAFPYELTQDQQQSVAQIEADMESPHNMDRLLCGDVGYGKTEVALRAAFKAVVEGKQVALLAPTTILVQQHYNTIKKRFSGFEVRVDMLSRFRTAAEQKETLKKLEKGELDMIVGTHRLLGKDVKFHDLGLLIVDEEQRFGVNHKEAIKNMKEKVDVLTLSATPIPRTLHMSMVGIRDMSLLETPPEERLPVKTYVMDYDDGIIREAIRRELQRDGQVYFLYNRVRSIEQMRQRIQALVPEARIGVAHGQMRENALEDVMLDFYAGAYDVLLCTTIVESGLDVPEANTLIVFDADHFGLSQLYQIRGRVGRSSRQAYAYFTVRANKNLSETAQKRLNAIREFTEFGAGYRIAMRDLEIRGAGDVLGPEQSGHLSTVGYDMYVKLIEQAVGEAQGKEQIPELDTRVELNIDAYLPETYVREERLRVEVYKRIAMVEDEETRLSIEEELIDRFGDIPGPVENLIRIAQLRGVTRKLGVSRLSLRPDGVHLRLDEQHMPEPDRLFEAITRADNRLRFAVSKTPELILCERNLSPEAAVELAIPVMTKVHDELSALKTASKDPAAPEKA